jgi:hypothetical protein
MSDVENELDMLQRKLATKTREIEAAVTEQQHLGDLNAMQSTDYARLQTYVEGTDLQMAGGEGSSFRVQS